MRYIVGVILGILAGAAVVFVNETVGRWIFHLVCPVYWFIIENGAIWVGPPIFPSGGFWRFIVPDGYPYEWHATALFLDWFYTLAFCVASGVCAAWLTFAHFALLEEPNMPSNESLR